MLRFCEEFIFILFSATFAPKDALCNASEEAKLPLLQEYSSGDFFKPASYCPTHILCDKYFDMYRTNIGDNEKCTKKAIRLKLLKQKEKNLIVKAYNNFRNDLATGEFRATIDFRTFPNAADVMQLEWDDDLEEEARRLLGICSDQFVEQYLTAFGKTKNVFVADVYPLHNTSQIDEFSLQSDISSAITEEAKNFDPIILDYTFDEKYDAFTVAAYAKSRYIGCARTQPYWKDFGNESVYALDFACLLMPSERRLYSKPFYNRLYLVGKPCSLCPAGSKCSSEYPNLCRKVNSNKFGGIKEHENYCKLQNQHVLCPSYWKYVSEKVCENSSESDPMEEKKILKTLRIYNDIRRSVAYGTSDFYDGLPRSADMNILEWDYQLQTASERILFNCKFKELFPELLKFGDRGELQAVKTVLVYNESDGAEKALNALLKEQIYFIQQQITNNITKEEMLLFFTNFSNSETKYNAIKYLLLAESKYIGCAEGKSYPNIPSNKVGDVVQLCLLAAPYRNETKLLYISGENCTRCKLNFYCNDGLCNEIRNEIERPDRYCDVNAKHILCREWDPLEVDRKSCDTLRKVYLEPADVENILTVYNEFREVVATNKTIFLSNTGPSSGVIMKLKWDTELQVAAERILSLCLNVEEVSGEQLTFGRHGESPASAFHLSHNGSSFREELMKAFTKEIQDYDAGKKYKRLTSLVFSRARYIGCARMVPFTTPNDNNKLSEVCVFGSSAKHENDHAPSYTGETFQTSSSRTNSPELSTMSAENVPDSAVFPKNDSAISSIEVEITFKIVSMATPRSSTEKFRTDDSGTGILGFTSTTTPNSSTKESSTEISRTGIQFIVGVLVLAVSTIHGISLRY